jgi:hypothetical protein
MTTSRGGLLVMTLAAAGCTTTLKVSTTQPNPLVAFPDQTTHRSEKLFIDLEDMDLPRLHPVPHTPDGIQQTGQFRLRQSAYFAIVSRDRLRFHVTIVHKWKEVADPTSWNVRLEDDQGHVYYPEAKEVRYNDLVTQMWDREQRTALYDTFGNVESVRSDGWKRRLNLESVDVFQGSGDFSFHAKDLFQRQTHRITLRMEKMGVVYEFTWNLVDHAGDENLAEANRAD